MATLFRLAALILTCIAIQVLVDIRTSVRKLEAEVSAMTGRR